MFARENEWMEFVTDHYVKERYMCNLLNCKKVRKYEIFYFNFYNFLLVLSVF